MTNKNTFRRQVSLFALIFGAVLCIVLAISIQFFPQPEIGTLDQLDANAPLVKSETQEPPGVSRTRIPEDPGGRFIGIRSVGADDFISDAAVTFKGEDGTLYAGNADRSGLVPCRLTAPFEVIVDIGGYLPEVRSSESLNFDAKGIATITLTPSGSIKVRVVTLNSEPVAGAFILPSSGSFFETTPDNWPKFILNLPDKPGEAAKYQLSKTDERGETILRRLPCATPIWLTARGPFIAQKKETTIDPTTRNVEVLFTVDEGLEVTGRVLYEDGRPFEKADVELELVGSPIETISKLRVKLSDAQGRYQFSGLPPGKIQVHCSNPGSPNFLLEIKDAVTVIDDLVLPSPRKFDGRVVSKFILPNSKLFGFSVVEDGKKTGWAACDQYADFEGETISRKATLVVWFRFPGDDGFTILRTEVIEFPAKNLNIAIDDLTGAVEIQSAPGLSLRGARVHVVPVPSGSPKQNGGRRGRTTGLTWTPEAETGPLVFGGLPPRTYNISVDLEGRGGFSWNDVLLSPGRSTVLTMDSIASGSVKGICSLEGAGSTLNVRVIAENDVPNKRKVACASDGTFTIDSLSVGTWRVHAEDNSSEAVSFASDVLTIEVRAASKETIQLPLLKLAEVTGVLRDSQGNPRPRTGVVLQNVRGNPVFDVDSDLSGRFKFSRVPPGSYVLACIDGSTDIRTLDIKRGDTIEADLYGLAFEGRARIFHMGTQLSGRVSAKLYNSSNQTWNLKFDEDGTIHVPSLRGPAVLWVWKFYASPEPHSDHYFSCVPAGAPVSGDLQAPTGTITLKFSEPSNLYQRPQIRVLSVHGINLPSNAIQLSDLIDTKNERIVRKVPHNSKLQISGLDLQNRPTVREVDFVSGDLTIDWP